MDTTATKRQRLYIVSFGNSKKYRYEYADSNSQDDLKNHPHPAEEIEQQLHDWLRHEFPGDTSLAYYYTPRLVEVEWSHRDRYADYPELDAKAIDDIKAELRKEILDQKSVRTLNDDAPQSKI